jgi:hypothetical protein
MNNLETATVQNGMAGIVLVIFGTLTARERLSEKTRRDCACAVFECRRRTRPTAQIRGGKPVQKNNRCPATFILVSRENTLGLRKKTVEEMEKFLISCWDVSPESIITVEGRRSFDIAKAIMENKLSNRVVVVIQKSPLLPWLSLLEFKFKQNGISTPEYTSSDEQRSRLLAGRKQ